MYEVNVGIEIGGEYYKAGSLIPESKIPKKSKKWLLEQNVISKQSKKNFIKEEIKKELVIDDVDTEFEEE